MMPVRPALAPLDLPTALPLLLLALRPPTPRQGDPWAPISSLPRKAQEEELHCPPVHRQADLTVPLVAVRKGLEAQLLPRQGLGRRLP